MAANRDTLRLVTLCAIGLLLCVSASAKTPQERRCGIEYENHNQADYGPLKIAFARGVVTDAGRAAVAHVCVGLFTEEQHRLIASNLTQKDGSFSFRRVPPGRYRLVVKAEPLCAANVPLDLRQDQSRKRALRIIMKPRGLDDCSSGETASSEK